MLNAFLKLAIKLKQFDDKSTRNSLKYLTLTLQIDADDSKDD